MTRDEKTSPRIAKIAAKVLAERLTPANAVVCLIGEGRQVCGLYWRDIRALAASCLTQTADKAKPTTPIERELTRHFARVLREVRAGRLSIDQGRAHAGLDPIQPYFKKPKTKPKRKTRRPVKRGYLTGSGQKSPRRSP